MDSLCSCLELKRDIEQLEKKITLTLEEVAKAKAANEKLIEKYLVGCGNVVCFQLKNK